MKDIGVYVHIPFCKAKCYYCDFVSYAGKQYLIEEYIEALIKEIKEVNLDQYNIKTLYIGGGTPSLIDSKLIREIVETINPPKEAETTIEVNPGTASREKLQSYIDSGINRLSIGLQSTKDKLLKEIRKNSHI